MNTHLLKLPHPENSRSPQQLWLRKHSKPHSSEGMLKYSSLPEGSSVKEDARLSLQSDAPKTYGVAYVSKQGVHRLAAANTCSRDVLTSRELAVVQVRSQARERSGLGRSKGGENGGDGG
jgi:hypothetical protein